MKTRLLAGLFLLFAIITCDNQKEPDEAVAEKPDYFPLTAGSYWVYNSYEIDSVGDETLVSEYDTIRITGDTIINGNEFKIFLGKRWGALTSQLIERYFRDSSGYIVNEEGTIMFSRDNFTDTLLLNYEVAGSDTLYWCYAMMEDFPGEITMPAGVFDSLLNYKLTILNYDSINSLIRSNDYLFAPNVGKLSCQYFYLYIFKNEKKYFEERLTDCYIAP